MTETKTASTIARQRVDDLAARHGEAGWLKEARLSDWELYLKCPMPTPRDQDWHGTDLSALDLSAFTAVDFQPVEPKSPPEHPFVARTLRHFSRRAGVIVQAVGRPGYIELDAGLAARGVILCDLSTALREHGDRLRPYLAVPAKPDLNKFGLMARALFNCGLFLFVPPGVEIDLPILSMALTGGATAGSAIFPRLIVLAGDNSKVSLIHASAGEGAGRSGGGESAPVLHSGLVEIQAGAGARVSFLDLYQFGSNVVSVNRSEAAVAQDAEFTSLTVALGGGTTKSDIATYLQAPGAASWVSGLVLGSGHEHFNFNTIEEHNAPDTRSDINFRVALGDSSASVYQGIIRVARVAQRTNAYQQNRNLLLGGQSKADSIPKLEILADDVKCSHGATVGPVDRDQIFYLMSRGLTESEAEELIVLGFFKTVLESYPVAEAVDWVLESASQKLFRKPSGQTPAI